MVAVAAAVVDLSARVVAVAAAAVVAVAVVADLSARVVGHGAAAAVSRKAVVRRALSFPAGCLLRHVVRCISTVVPCKTVVSLQDGGSLAH